MSALAIETLSAADIPHNVALCHAVGWPDTEAEWRVIRTGARRSALHWRLKLGAERARMLLPWLLVVVPFESI